MKPFVLCYSIAIGERLRSGLYGSWDGERRSRGAPSCIRRHARALAHRCRASSVNVSDTLGGGHARETPVVLHTLGK